MARRPWSRSYRGHTASETPNTISTPTPGWVSAPLEHPHRVAVAEVVRVPRIGLPGAEAADAHRHELDPELVVVAVAELLAY